MESPDAHVEGVILEGGAAVYRARGGRGGDARAVGAARFEPVAARGAALRTPGSGSRAEAASGNGLAAALRRFPSPRLTGLGAGLFASAAMLLVGFLDRLVLDGSPLAFGLLFLPVSALTALWVRPADLVTAPIAVPIAFAIGVIPIAGGTGGLGGQAMAVVTALAVHAGWLYGGTLVAGLITCVRKVLEMGRRQRGRSASALPAKSASAKSASARSAPRKSPAAQAVGEEDRRVVKRVVKRKL